VRAIADGFAEVETPLGLLKGRDGGRLAVGAPATLFVRPERLRPAASGIPARVAETAFEGHLTHIGMRAADGHKLNMSLGRDLGADTLTPGDQIAVAYDPAEAIVLRNEG
jgi:spermidine/putrescine transport system ATP-binding protein